MINTFRNACSYSSTSQIKYPPILTQQIMADFQISQEAWNQLSSQMNEIFKTNKLLKKAVQDTYNIGKCTEIESKKSFKHKENCKKIRKSCHIC